MKPEDRARLDKLIEVGDRLFAEENAKADHPLTRRWPPQRFGGTRDDGRFQHARADPTRDPLSGSAKERNQFWTEENAKHGRQFGAFPPPGGAQGFGKGQLDGAPRCLQAEPIPGLASQPRDSDNDQGDGLAGSKRPSLTPEEHAVGERVAEADKQHIDEQSKKYEFPWGAGTLASFPPVEELPGRKRVAEAGKRHMDEPSKKFEWPWGTLQPCPPVEGTLELREQSGASNQSQAEPILSAGVQSPFFPPAGPPQGEEHTHLDRETETRHLAGNSRATVWALEDGVATPRDARRLVAGQQHNNEVDSGADEAPPLEGAQETVTQQTAAKPRGRHPNTAAPSPSCKRTVAKSPICRVSARAGEKAAATRRDARHPEGSARAQSEPDSLPARQGLAAPDAPTTDEERRTWTPTEPETFSFSKLFPPDFPRYYVANGLNEISAYLANASYVVSLGGPPASDLKYGIVVVPLGEESLLLGGSRPDEADSKELRAAVAEARRKEDVEFRREYAEKMRQWELERDRLLEAARAARKNRIEMERMHEVERESETFRRRRFDDGAGDRASEADSQPTRFADPAHVRFGKRARPEGEDVDGPPGNSPRAKRQRVDASPANEAATAAPNTVPATLNSKPTRTELVALDKEVGDDDAGRDARDEDENQTGTEAGPAQPSKRRRTAAASKPQRSATPATKRKGRMSAAKAREQPCKAAKASTQLPVSKTGTTRRKKATVEKSAAAVDSSPADQARRTRAVTRRDARQ